jgi:thiamine pyrophosphate-dependent acetolactate synthase large subunit-like protein
MPGMPLEAALRVFLEMRTNEIVVTTMGSARVWPRLSQHPLDFHFVPSSMGQAPALGLGLALAQPDREVLVLNGDGCMLMNPAVLTTIAASGARNITVAVLDNGIYEVTGGQKTAAAGHVDFPAMAVAFGFAAGSVAKFSELDAWRASVRKVLAAPGPRFLSLAIAPEAGDTHLEAPGPMPERIARFKAALVLCQVLILG